jgi:hypothetical protein
MRMLWLFSLLSVICVCYGQTTWTCMSSNDAFLVNSSSKKLEEKIHSLEVQVKQLQRLVRKQDRPSYTSIEGFPRGNKLLHVV